MFFSLTRNQDYSSQYQNDKPSEVSGIPSANEGIEDLDDEIPF